MGIDIYMIWKGQTHEEHEAQITGFDTGSGHVGYLKEAWRGKPYATRVLLPECFGQTNVATIKAGVLRSRLKSVLLLAARRQKDIYGHPRTSEETKLALKSFSDFVELAERKEKETGEPVTVRVRY